MMILSTKQVGQRIRRGTLPLYSKGEVRCTCHPDLPQKAQTESLRFWQKGMMVGCGGSKRVPGGYAVMAPALAVFPEIDIAIDTTL